MKKMIAIMAFGLILSGCSGNSEPPQDLGGKTLQIGTGIYSQNTAIEGQEPMFITDITYATVAMENDVIVYVDIDTAENKGYVGQEFKPSKTKKELGKNYGMNWDEQVSFLEEYLIGKTIEEATHTGNVEADLTSSVTISISPHLAAVHKALDSLVEAKNVTTVGQTSLTSGQVDDKRITIDTNISAIALDSEGSIVYRFNDEVSMKADIEEGMVIPNGNTLSKYELKDHYGMGTDKTDEWYVQIDTLNDWLLGKNINDIKGISDESDISSSVTINTDNIMSAINKAIKKQTP